MATKERAPSYSRVACIGAGLAGIALGVQLKRWYNLDDIQLFERNDDLGGTWYVNSYPGCACDIPSALYSYSFAPNPNWTMLMPPYKEIKNYVDTVVDAYNLRNKITFSAEVYRSIWQEDKRTWLLYLRDVKTGHEFTHECQILFSAIGGLSEPRPCDIPGASSFKGAIFHSAKWNHDVDLTGKNVVIIGNGCTAAQIVPAIVNKVKSVTQVIRTQHWVVPAHNFTYNTFLKWVFRNIPFAMLLHRFTIFLIAENGWRLFPMTNSAARLRQRRRRNVEKYMKETAPAKYHDLLIPKFEIGCKRRIFDCGYLESLNNEKVLLTDAKTQEIVPEGLKTSKGLIPADVIVLATGFKTNSTEFLDVRGRNGKMVSQHWTEFGGPEGYNCSVMHGFPNFFLLLGPNSITGHTSAIMAIENSINYAFRILKPIFQEEATTVEIKKEAEDSYVSWMQSALQNTVWNTGCQSWYVSANKQWNAMAYPRSQLHYWYRSLFPVWTDWNIEMKPSRKSYKGRCILALLTTGALAAVGSLAVLHCPTPSLETYVSRIQDLLLDLPLGSWQSTVRNVAEYIPKVGWW